METSALLVYMATLMAITASPGPLMAVMVARTLGRDTGGAMAYAVGIGIGDMIAVTLICAGLGLWIEDTPALLVAAKCFGAGYLAWLAVAMWRSPDAVGASDHAAHRGSWLPSAVAGMVTCLSSPQTMLLYLALLPGVISLDRVSGLDYGALLAATAVALAIVFLAIILLAGSARELLVSGGGTQRCNRCLAVAIGIAGIWILTL